MRGRRGPRSFLGVDFRRLKPSVRKAQPIPEPVQARYGREGSLEVSAYGVVTVTSRQFPQSHRVHGPLFVSDDLDRFDWPQPDDVEPIEPHLERLRRWEQAGLCTVARCDNPFKVGCFMRPFEESMMDCLTRPDYVRELLGRIARVEQERAERGVRAGMYAVRPGLLVFLHSDGNLSEVPPDLIECGIDAVHAIEPEWRT